MQTCPGFFLKSLLECPRNLVEICAVKFVDTLLLYIVFVAGTAAGDDPPPPYTATADDSATKIDEFAAGQLPPPETSLTTPPCQFLPGYPLPPAYAAALYYPRSESDALVILQPQQPVVGLQATDRGQQQQRQVNSVVKYLNTEIFKYYLKYTLTSI